MKKLSTQKMESLKGGYRCDSSSNIGYCSTLWFIGYNNDLSPGASWGMNYGWNYANCDQYQGQEFYNYSQQCLY